MELLSSHQKIINALLCEIATCKICLCHFSDSNHSVPKCLDCSHTFCLICITTTSVENKIKCPICFVETNVDNIRNDATALSVLNILDKYDVIHTCDICEKQSTKDFCNMCEIKHYCCSKCSPSHHPKQFWAASKIHGVGELLDHTQHVIHASDLKESNKICETIAINESIFPASPPTHITDQNQQHHPQAQAVRSATPLSSLSPGAAAWSPQMKGAMKVEGGGAGSGSAGGVVSDSLVLLLDDFHAQVLQTREADLNRHTACHVELKIGVKSTYASKCANFLSISGGQVVDRRECREDVAHFLWREDQVLAKRDSAAIQRYDLFVSCPILVSSDVQARLGSPQGQEVLDGLARRTGCVVVRHADPPPTVTVLGPSSRIDNAANILHSCGKEFSSATRPISDGLSACTDPVIALSVSKRALGPSLQAPSPPAPITPIATERVLCVGITCDLDYVGRLIGVKGTRIMELREMFQCMISISKGSPCHVQIKGFESKVLQAIPAVKMVLAGGGVAMRRVRREVQAVSGMGTVAAPDASTNAAASIEDLQSFDFEDLSDMSDGCGGTEQLSFDFSSNNQWRGDDLSRLQVSSSDWEGLTIDRGPRRLEDFSVAGGVLDCNVNLANSAKRVNHLSREGSFPGDEVPVSDSMMHGHAADNHNHNQGLATSLNYSGNNALLRRFHRSRADSNRLSPQPPAESMPPKMSSDAGPDSARRPTFFPPPDSFENAALSQIDLSIQHPRNVGLQLEQKILQVPRAIQAKHVISSDDMSSNDSEFVRVNRHDMEVLFAVKSLLFDLAIGWRCTVYVKHHTINDEVMAIEITGKRTSRECLKFAIYEFLHLRLKEHCSHSQAVDCVFSIRSEEVQCHEEDMLLLLKETSIRYSESVRVVDVIQRQACTRMLFCINAEHAHSIMVIGVADAIREALILIDKYLLSEKRAASIAGGYGVGVPGPASRRLARCGSNSQHSVNAIRASAGAPMDINLADGLEKAGHSYPPEGFLANGLEHKAVDDVSLSFSSMFDIIALLDLPDENPSAPCVITDVSDHTSKEVSRRTEFDKISDLSQSIISKPLISSFEDNCCFGDISASASMRLEPLEGVKWRFGPECDVNSTDAEVVEVRRCFEPLQLAQIIGKRGSVLKELKKLTSCDIKVEAKLAAVETRSSINEGAIECGQQNHPSQPLESGDTDRQWVCISGTQAQVAKLEALMQSIVAVGVVKALGMVTAFVSCPHSKVPLVIGVRGLPSQEMMRRTGCKIHVNEDPATSDALRIEVTGTQSQIEEAVQIITLVLEHGTKALGKRFKKG